MEQKVIGVLTSGGDAPGMNAAVRSVVRTAIHKGFKVIGIKRGYNGLIHGDMEEMNMRSVSEIIHRGGTILLTARCKEFREEAGLQIAKQRCIEAGINGIVVIGGDGSFRGAADLSARGIPCVGVPCTIDNDIACSEYTIGYDTAMNTAVDLVDKLRDTSKSHDRCSLVEVMGRHAGYIAINTGIACGAVCVVVPEIGFNKDEIIAKIKHSVKLGKHHFIIVIAEGICNLEEVAEQINKATGIETRSTILGHVQRGGNPTVRDRVYASQMGHRAVDLLANGIGNRVVGIKANQLVDFDIQEALTMQKSFDMSLYKIANEISF